MAIQIQCERTQETGRDSSGTETVESAAGTLKSVHDVERSDGLALGVLSVCDGVTDDLKERWLGRDSQRERLRERTFSRKILSTPRVSS
jgi:hypothetical protein